MLTTDRPVTGYMDRPSSARTTKVRPHTRQQPRRKLPSYLPQSSKRLYCSMYTCLQLLRSETSTAPRPAPAFPSATPSLANQCNLRSVLQTPG